MPEGGCDPVRSLCWSRLLPGPVDPWREEPTLEQVCWHFGMISEKYCDENWKSH